MVVTPSNMRELGTPAPHFALPEPRTGNTLTLSDVRKPNGLLVVFMCNHCPFVIMLQHQLRLLGEHLATLNIGMVGISSNDIQMHPQDGPVEMAHMANTVFTSFPYLLDETQNVAKAYHAACTPDTFLYDADMNLVYRGQIDDARPGNGIEVTGNSVRDAAHLLSMKQPIPEHSMKPAIGCNIKWKS